MYDRQWMRTHWLDVPVVSVGNLTTGGTGKTPMVIKLAEISDELGCNPGIVLRGYGRRGDRESDEVMLYRRELPGKVIAADPDRVEAGKTAISESADVIIADDAFQHRRLGRDLNICLIDACFPFGADKLLPAGRLREPITEINRADLVIITRCDQIEADALNKIISEIQKITSDVPILRTTHKPIRFIDANGDTYPLETIAKGRIFAFSAIARPESFHRTIRSLEAEIAGSMSFRDHHFFSDDELANINRQAENLNIDYIICSCKDMVKLPNIDTGKILALEIEIEFMDDGETILTEKLRQVVTEFSREKMHDICTGKSVNS